MVSPDVLYFKEDYLYYEKYYYYHIYSKNFYNVALSDVGALFWSKVCSGLHHSVSFPRIKRTI